MEKKRFNEIIKIVMDYNDYPNDCLTVEKCEKIGRWTPVDLICREYYNNGCGSAKGFLGITPLMCEKAFVYIREHNAYFVEQNMLSETGISNCDSTLWSNYKLH